MHFIKRIHMYTNTYLKAESIYIFCLFLSLNLGTEGRAQDKDLGEGWMNRAYVR